MIKNIRFLISLSICILVTLSLLFVVRFNVSASDENCCDGTDGHWYDGCCAEGGSSCCAPSNVVSPCEVRTCPTCSDETPTPPPPPECHDCSLPDCPAPLVNDGEEAFKLKDYRECTKTGGCGEKKRGSCFEVPSTPPTTSIQVYPSGEVTSKGCLSTTYTGTEANNPIRMVSTHTDQDGANDIEALYIWLKMGDGVPVTPKYIDFTNPTKLQAATYTKDSYGFMMHKEGDNWYPYILSKGKSEKDDRWVRANYSDKRFLIKGPSGVDMVYVNVNSISLSGNDVTFDFSLDYRNIIEVNRVKDGSYNIFVMTNDVFGFTPYDNYSSEIKIKNYFSAEEIRYYENWVDSSKDWLYDFTPPTVTSVSSLVEQPPSGGSSSRIENPTRIQFSWVSSDIVGLYAVVSNAYISDGVQTSDTLSDVSLTSLGNKSIGILPFSLLNVSQSGNQIGNFEDGYLAKAININTASDRESISMNIGSNREGSLIYYATAFDYACNYSGSNNTYNLEDWIITNGGLTYSSGGIDFSVKNVEAGSWNSVNLLKKINPVYADITSELYAGDNSTAVLNKLVKSNVAKSYSISPFKGYKDISFYTDLKSTFEKREVGLSGITRITSLGSSLGGGIKVLDRNGDLSLDSYLCDGKGMFFVSGNLTLNGNITNSNPNSDACIFVVKGNVTIKEGTSATGSIGYDEINAYIITEGDLIVTEDSHLDGLYINGGIQARGNIISNRYLALGYRNSHPSLVVNHHSKYGMFTTMLIGSPVDTIKTEVGFKPY